MSAEPIPKASPDNIIDATQKFMGYVRARETQMQTDKIRTLVDFEGYRAADVLYEKHVEPYFPKEPKKGHLQAFLTHSVPILIHRMCPDAVKSVGAFFYHRHSEVWLMAVEDFKQRLFLATEDALKDAILMLPKPIQALYHKLKKPKWKYAVLICWSMWRHHRGPFPLAARDLMNRLFLKDHKQGIRVFEKLIKVGFLVREKSGLTRWDSRRLGVRDLASMYRLGDAFR